MEKLTFGKDPSEIHEASSHSYRWFSHDVTKIQTTKLSILARVFVYLPPFISQILALNYWTVLIVILSKFEWCDTENQQLSERLLQSAGAQHLWERFFFIVVVHCSSATLFNLFAMWPSAAFSCLRRKCVWRRDDFQLIALKCFFLSSYSLGLHVTSPKIKLRNYRFFWVSTFTRYYST